MCQFCVEHGEGERWYLRASNYAFDLESDVRRRRYVVGFISDFAEMRTNAISWMERFERLPAPLSAIGKSAISKRQQANHFGQPVPLEECERILELATSITVIPCICRMHEPGKHADEVCLLVTTQPVEALLIEGFASYTDGPDLDDFNELSVSEAMELLCSCELDGLMHSVWTFKTPFTAAICNCNVESGCMAMKLTTGYGLKIMWRGEWVAQLHEARCTRCGRCARLCPFTAIDASRASVAIDAGRCWGCGVCRSACAEGAISLLDRRAVPSVATLW